MAAGVAAAEFVEVAAVLMGFAMRPRAAAFVGMAAGFVGMAAEVVGMVQFFV